MKKKDIWHNCINFNYSTKYCTFIQKIQSLPFEKNMENPRFKGWRKCVGRGFRWGDFPILGHTNKFVTFVSMNYDSSFRGKLGKKLLMSFCKYWYEMLIIKIQHIWIIKGQDTIIKTFLSLYIRLYNQFFKKYPLRLP